MGKKILTIKMLRNKLLEYAILPLLVCLIAYLPAFLITLFFAVRSAFFLFACVMYVCMISFGFLLVFYLTTCLPLLFMAFRPIVVIATRTNTVGVKVTIWHRLMHPRRRFDECIHFHGYGAFYTGPVDERSTSVGDKFYLLLDRSGHIIDYYPCNDYEYEGELTPNKYER